MRGQGKRSTWPRGLKFWLIAILALVPKTTEARIFWNYGQQIQVIALGLSIKWKSRRRINCFLLKDGKNDTPKPAATMSEAEKLDKFRQKNEKSALVEAIQKNLPRTKAPKYLLRATYNSPHFVLAIVDSSTNKVNPPWGLWTPKWNTRLFL